MIDEIVMQLALRARALTLSVATTGTISLAATATGYTRATSTGTVSAVAGVATFSASQAGVLANGSVIVVAGVSYTVSAFNGTTGATLTGAAPFGSPTFGASAFTMGFQVENFWPGMEVAPAGFATNTPRVITAVTPLAITVDTTLAPMTAEGAAGGRSLTVGLPSQRAWENIAFEPTAGVPWMREELLPGPTAQVTLGPNGELELLPMYVLSVNVPAESGLTVKRYVNALRVLFAPRTAIALPNGDVLRVRSDTGPYAAQLLQGEVGFAVQPLTIPLRLRTQNVI